MSCRAPVYWQTAGYSWAGRRKALHHQDFLNLPKLPHLMQPNNGEPFADRAGWTGGTVVLWPSALTGNPEIMHTEPLLNDTLIAKRCETTMQMLFNSV